MSNDTTKTPINGQELDGVSDLDEAVELAADEIGFEPDTAAEAIPDDQELRSRHSSGRPYGRTITTISSQVCENYLAPDQRDRLRKLDPRTVADDLLGQINDEIFRENRLRADDEVIGLKLDPLKSLGFAEIAALVIALDRVVAIKPSVRSTDPDLYLVATYDGDRRSPHCGTYRASQSAVFERAARYRSDVSTKELGEVYAVLRRDAPRVVRGQDRDLVAVGNGVINYNSGSPKFMPFDPKYVFLSKLDVNWNPDATNVVIHNDEDGTDWDVESWMQSLSDDPEIVQLLWEIVGACVRPYVRWNKIAFFFATSGNNGKGTLLEMIKNILGIDNYASIPLADFGKDFMLEPLLRASAILVDENDVGTFLDKAANIKAVATNDTITINGKYKKPVIHQHWGFMVQCYNDRPQVKDKSESWYRRNLLVPFTKSFTGVERKYIKDDYLTRAAVLEYVLKRVLEMNYYNLSEPAACKVALEESKEAGDPVRAFWIEKKFEFEWDLVPFQFAYDLYRAWLERNQPQSKAIGRNRFIDELVELVKNDKISPFECPDKSARHRPGGRMSKAETLITEFDLQDWINFSAPANQPTRRATMAPDQFKSIYRGLTRQEVVLPAATGAERKSSEPQPDWTRFGRGIVAPE